MAKKAVQVEPLKVDPDTPSRGRKLNDVTNELIGVTGTPARQEYEDLLERKLISAKLREYRMQHDISQAELGERIGVQRNQICRLERDASNISLNTLFKVFRALGVGIRLSYEESPPLKAVKLAVIALLFLAACPESPAAQAGAFFAH